ncbi:TPA: hypothetical protein UOA91_000299 [Stenotrophomonas maltophilia]|nr:hypothetical protein [Stenotrophomonas maltophilia]HEL3778059.1 hypothetical protein [Stenotrophomonas maltophilia]HEL5004129.1 hypothetical protein [Stenotrophomonas maltophilia]
MSAEVSATQYAQLAEFVSDLSNRDTDTLMIRFNLSAPVISEIFEALLVYFSPNAKLSAPPLTSQYEEFPLIVAYESTAGDISAELCVLENDEPSEAILYVVFLDAAPNELCYEFIKS